MVRSRFVCLFVVVVALAAGSRRFAVADTVLLDFTQATCAPCVDMEPVLQQLTAQGVQIQRIDVQRDPQLAARYRVNMTPTYIVLVEGREWARVTGKTKFAVMTEMLAKAQALAEEHEPRARGPRGSAVASIDFDVPAPMANQPQVMAGPQEGRVVPIQDPFAIRTPPRSAAAESGTRTLAIADAAGVPAADAARLIAATVRLSITDPKGRSTGTGAIVDARNGMALVITCGHLFRESQGQGAIEISIFAAGPTGAELHGTVAGELIDYDLDRDLALVRFRTESSVTVTPIAPAGTLLLPGAPVTSVGCNHGDNPTAVATTIKSINRYQGFPNVEVAGAPVEGRSGGGLFNANGQLIGVCFAADPEANEGLYASLKSIQDKLDSLQLASVYQSPGTGGVATPQAEAGNQLAATTPGALAIRGQDPESVSLTAVPGGLPSSPPTAAAAAAAEAAALAGLTPQERATLEEIARRSGGGEVICIIRPQSPEGRSDVIKLSGVSPAFVRALTAAAGTAAVQANAGAAPLSTAAAADAVRR
jgi:S1-C subfamily serine protease